MSKLSTEEIKELHIEQVAQGEKYNKNSTDIAKELKDEESEQEVSEIEKDLGLKPSR